MDDNHVSLKEHFEALRAADHRAIDAAFEAAKEKSASHNELIHAMERQSATFVTTAQVRWMFTALIAVIGLAVAVAVAFVGKT